MNVFTQTEIDTSSETEISPENAYFSNPENFFNQPETQKSTLKFDADDQFSLVENDTLQVFKHILTIFHFTVQIFHLKMFLQYWQKLF